MPLSVFRRAKAKIKIQALRQGLQVPISEIIAAGTVAADTVYVQRCLGAVWRDSAAGGVEALAVENGDVRKALAVCEGFSLVTAKLADGGEDFLGSVEC